MHAKKISIIMNCYNGEKYLHESLNSVINQNFENWELIFFDNCSTDKSKVICKEFKDKRIKYFRSTKKIKLGLARKIALSKIKGDFLVFLDVDDIWNKNKLSKQIKCFKNPKIGFSITNSIFFNENKKIYLYEKKKKFKKNVYYDLIENYFISFDTVMINKLFLKKLDHKLDQKFNIIHDMDLLIRLSAICEMNYLPFALSKWRMSTESDSYNKFGQIINEKKLFIKKISKNNKKNKDFFNSKIKYMDNLYRQEIFYHLTKKNYFKSFILIKKLKINLKNFILVLIIFFPFKKFIFNNILNLKY
jgi:glycosyltransferase involved in cell wall biosynthesis